LRLEKAEPIYAATGGFGASRAPNPPLSLLGIEGIRTDDAGRFGPRGVLLMVRPLRGRAIPRKEQGKIWRK
jgi:hypothetical protein